MNHFLAKLKHWIESGRGSNTPTPSPYWFNIQFVKIGQKIWADPPPPHLDKIQKNSNFFRETVPKELWENTPGSPWHIWCRSGSRGSRPEGPEWRPPSPPPPCSWQKDWAPTGKGVQLLVCNACYAVWRLGLEYLSFLWFQYCNHKNWSQKRSRYRYENVWYRKNSLGIKNKKKKLAQSKFWSFLFMMATW